MLECPRSLIRAEAIVTEGMTADEKKSGNFYINDATERANRADGYGYSGIRFCSIGTNG